MDVYEDPSLEPVGLMSTGTTSIAVYLYSKFESAWKYQKNSILVLKYEYAKKVIEEKIKQEEDKKNVSEPVLTIVNLLKSYPTRFKISCKGKANYCKYTVVDTVSGFIFSYEVSSFVVCSIMSKHSTSYIAKHNTEWMTISELKIIHKTVTSYLFQRNLEFTKLKEENLKRKVETGRNKALAYYK